MLKCQSFSICLSLNPFYFLHVVSIITYHIFLFLIYFYVTIFWIVLLYFVLHLLLLVYLRTSHVVVDSIVFYVCTWTKTNSCMS